MKNCFTFVLAVLIALLCTSPSRASSPVSIEIITVAPRPITQSAEPSGGIELSITNLVKQKVEIPFTTLNSETKVIKVAKIRYNWADTDGNTILKKSFLVCAGEIRLSPAGCTTLSFPVDLPKASGEYALFVEFDNTDLKETGDKKSCGYFSASATCKVSVPLLKNVPRSNESKLRADDKLLSIDLNLLTEADTKEEVVLQISLVNHSERGLYLPLNGAFGKGVFDERLNSSMSSASLIDFSRLKYEWVAADGVAPLSGVTDFCQSNVTIEANSQTHIFIPIKVPARAGSYKLAVDFDNSSMREVLCSHNLISAPPPYVTRFLRASKSCNVQVPFER